MRVPNIKCFWIILTWKTILERFSNSLPTSSPIYFLFSYQAMKNTFKYYSSDEEVCHSNYFSMCPMGTYYMMNDDGLQVINLNPKEGEKIFYYSLWNAGCQSIWETHPSSWYFSIELFRNKQRNRKLLLIHLQWWSE